MNITQFLHATVLVTDLDQATHFYGAILGLSSCHRPLNFPGAWFQVGDLQLHLIQVPSLLSDQVNAQKWGRNRHLAFAVTDLETAKARLVSENIPIQMSTSGRSALFVQDPDNNIIELSQAPV